MARNFSGIFLRIAMRYLAHVYVSASRKLRLQCAAVYCLSWLFSPQLPVPPSSLFLFLFLPVIGDLLSSGRKIVLSSRSATPSRHPRVQWSLSWGRERGRLFIPTGVERVAIPRGEPPWSCKSYERVIREGRRKAKKKPGDWRRGEGGRERTCDSLLVTRIDRPA